MYPYLKQWANCYRACNKEKREQSKQHWIKCRKEAIEMHDYENANFAANVLATIVMIENEETHAA